MKIIRPAVLVLVAVLCSALAIAQPKPNWGDKPIPDPIVKGTAVGAGGCYATHTKQGSDWQVQCDAQNCERHRISFAGANANMEAIGCAAKISCFAYNHNGTVACYTDRKQCDTARSKIMGATLCRDLAKTGKVDMSGDDNWVADDFQTCFVNKVPGTPIFATCFGSRAACADLSAQKKRSSGDVSHPAMTIILGCTRAGFYCFPYNGGNDAGCYTDGSACVTNRNRIAGAGPCKQINGDDIIR